MDLEEIDTRICAGFVWLKRPRGLQQQHCEYLQFVAVLQLILIIEALIWAIGSACVLFLMPCLLCSGVVSGNCRHLYHGILPYPDCHLIFFVSWSFLPVLAAVCLQPCFSGGLFTTLFQSRFVYVVVFLPLSPVNEFSERKQETQHKIKKNANKATRYAVLIE